MGAVLKVAHRLVLLLLFVQVLATAFLWTLNPTGRSAQATFATFLGVDLLAFAVVSYLYRSDRSRDRASRAWIVLGLGVIVLLLLSSLFTA